MTPERGFDLCGRDAAGVFFLFLRFGERRGREKRKSVTGFKISVTLFIKGFISFYSL